MGLAHDAMGVLEAQGWEAFLQLRAAQRRAQRRLVWSVGKLGRFGKQKEEEAEEPEQQQAQPEEEPGGDKAAVGEEQLAAVVVQGGAPAVTAEAEAKQQVRWLRSTCCCFLC